MMPSNSKVMKFALLIFAIFILTATSTVSYAQTCSDNPPNPNCRMVGKAKVYYSENLKPTKANIRIYLLGKPGDIGRGKNADFLISNDVLNVHISYNAFQNIKPGSIQLEFYSFSNEKWKYKNNHKLEVYLDDKLLLSANTDEGRTLGWIAESFSLEMKFTDFFEIVNGKKVVIQFGDTKVKLKPEDMEALNDLYKTTEQLSPRPKYVSRGCI